MQYNAVKLTVDKPMKKRLETGMEYGILMVVRGAVHANETFSVGQEDILVCKPRQVLNLEYTGAQSILTVMFVRISLELLEEFSTERTDLPGCFRINPNPVAVLRGRSELLMLLKNLALWLVDLPGQKDRLSYDILEEGTLKMFISLVLRLCMEADLKLPEKKTDFALDNVFNFIHTHLTEDLSLERLEKEFFISRHHLIRQFKKKTGQTVHQYIVKARLDRCRGLIAQGMSVSEVYRKGGFQNYNHFFRAFRQEYGMTPKEYYRTVSTGAAAGGEGSIRKKQDVSLD